MSHVREINDPAELDEIRLAWSLLLPQTRGASFFQSLDWLQAYWRFYGAAQRLRVLVVSALGQPVGILPLVVRSEATRLGRLRFLTYPLDDWGAFYGPIGPNPAATLLEGLRHVHSTPRDWDLVDLRWIGLHSQDAGRTANAMRLSGFQPHLAPMFDTALIEMAGGWDAYWASRKADWRSNVRRCEKRVAKSGDVTYHRYRPQGAAAGDADPHWDLYDACEQIARKSWQGSSDTGTTLSHESVRAYLRHTHEVAVRAGGLDLSLLSINGVPAAFCYGYHYRGHTFGLRLGFDPDVCGDGAGTVLHHRVIRESFERGDHTYDMGPGYLHAKRYWQTRLEKTYRYTHYAASSLRAQALWLKRKIASWSSRQEVA